MEIPLKIRQTDIINALPAHVCLLDQKGNIFEVNSQWKQFALDNDFGGVNFGIGSNYVEVCETAVGLNSDEAGKAAELCRTVLSGKASHLELEYPCHSPTQHRWFNLTVSRLNKTKSAGAVVMHTDITERKQFENRLRRDANHDPLTGLANRTLFLDHLQMTIERAKRNPQELFGVMFLDLDEFKSINDSFGHSEGDNLLKQIASRLESVLRSSDLIARLGGDEFTILFICIENSAAAAQIAERIQDALKAAFEIGNGEIFITASIGIALSTAKYDKAEEILHAADVAMYRAKAQGKARCVVFTSAMR